MLNLITLPVVAFHAVAVITIIALGYVARWTGLALLASASTTVAVAGVLGVGLVTFWGLVALACGQALFAPVKRLANIASVWIGRAFDATEDAVRSACVRLTGFFDWRTALMCLASLLLASLALSGIAVAATSLVQGQYVLSALYAVAVPVVVKVTYNLLDKTARTIAQTR